MGKPVGLMIDVSGTVPLRAMPTTGQSSPELYKKQADQAMRNKLVSMPSMASASLNSALVIVVHRCHIWIGLLIALLPWQLCMAPSGTLKASPGREKLLAQTQFSSSKS